MSRPHSRPHEARESCPQPCQGLGSPLLPQTRSPPLQLLQQAQESWPGLPPARTRECRPSALAFPRTQEAGLPPAWAQGSRHPASSAPRDQASRPIALSSLKDSLLSQILSVAHILGIHSSRLPQLPNSSCIQHSLTPAEEEEEGARDSWGAPSPSLPPPNPSQKRGEATWINSPPSLESCCRRLPIPAPTAPSSSPPQSGAQRLGGCSGTLRKGCSLG